MNTGIEGNCARSGGVTVNCYDLISEAWYLKNELVRIRRHLHMYPELGLEEHRTAAMVENTLQHLGISTQRVAGTGVIGLLSGASSGRTVALRADMDALPLTDEKKVDYASKMPGKMHACGHDAHTAALLGAAMLLTKHRWEFAGNVKFLFQPAEETVGGALPMIEEGAMENPQVDAVFGLHTDVDIDVGKIGIIYGKANAASDTFDVVICGRGSHGAAPHKGVDAIAVGAQIITALQNVVSRNVDPVDAAVVTVGVIQGGYQRNIIADELRFSGIIRTLDPKTRQAVLQRVKDTVAGIASAMGAKALVRISPSYPSLINDNHMVDLVKDTAEEMLGRRKVVLVKEPNMGVEDFAYFLQRVPGAFFRLGVRNEQKGIVHASHSSLFDIDEDALVIGAAMHAAVALRYLRVE